MVTETTYEAWELTYGRCKCCSEMSDEIVIGDGRCVDCIEMERFYEESMKQANKKCHGYW